MDKERKKNSLMFSISQSKYAKMKTEQESENQSDDEQNETGFLGITLKKQRYYVLG